MSEAAAAPSPAPASPDASSAALDAFSGGPVNPAARGLDALFDGVELADPAGATAEGEATDADSAEPAADKDAPKGREAPDDLIFSDEQLQSPEGIQRAKARVTELRKMQHTKYLELKGYERHVGKKAEKLRASVAEFKSEKNSHSLLLNNVRSNLQGLHSGDPETILTALGNLTGTDGFKAYELLTSRIVNKGRAPLDPQIQAILDSQAQEIENLKRGTQERETEQRVQQTQAQINSHLSRIGEQIRTSADTPHLTRIFNDDPERLTQHIFDEIVRTNGAKPAHQLFREMEQELQAHLGAVTPKGASGGTAPKQLTSAQSSPGRSVGPSTAAAASNRVPTEQEILRNLANDTELLASLGL
jgi:uncharacterized protein YukE